MRRQAAQDVLIDTLTHENAAHTTTNLQQETDSTTQLTSLHARIKNLENDKLQSSLREAENLAHIDSQDIMMVGINKRQQDNEAHIQNQDALLVASQVKVKSPSEYMQLLSPYYPLNLRP